LTTLNTLCSRDSDRQRRDDHDGQSSRSPERAKGVSDVLQKIGHRPLDVWVNVTDSTYGEPVTREIGGSRDVAEAAGRGE